MPTRDGQVVSVFNEPLTGLPALIQVVVDDLVGLGYTPKVVFSPSYATVSVPFGGLPHPVSTSVSARIADRMPVEKAARIAKMMHEACVRGEAKRMGLLENAFHTGLNEAMTVAPEYERAIAGLQPPNSIRGGDVGMAG